VSNNGYIITDTDASEHASAEIAAVERFEAGLWTRVGNKDIGFNATDVVRLYLNHRPVVALTFNDIAAAFGQLGADSEAALIDRNTLIQLLMSEGEKMTEAELTECIQTLQ
ncbi:hypothetical protein KIPB_016137, partial [Kipferlia bialata]